MSRILLSGIRGVGYHGVLTEERVHGQEFVVDVLMEVDTTRAEKSDDVVDTVHYGEVAEAVHGLIIGPPVNLIETLAGQIADRVLTFPRVDRVSVTVHKPAAPITVPFVDVAVTVERMRSS